MFEKTDNKYFLNLSNNQLNETLKSSFKRFFKFMKNDVNFKKINLEEIKHKCVYYGMC